MVIKHIIKNKKLVLLCCEIICKGNYFSTPCNSSIVSMYNVSHEIPTLIAISPENIFTKCILCWRYKVVIATIPTL